VFVSSGLAIRALSGEAFVCHDANGEEPVSAIVASIDNSGPLCVVSCLDETRHGLEDGDCVTFSEVGGMEALNGCEPRPVKVTGPYSFTIEGVETFGTTYTRGGLVKQVKQSKARRVTDRYVVAAVAIPDSTRTSFQVLGFKSLRESLASPEFVVSDYAKFDRPMQLHLGVQARIRIKSFPCTTA